MQIETVKSLLTPARALLREGEVIDARETQAKLDLSTAADGKSLDDPAVQRTVAAARSWLDLCESRRGSLEREIRATSSELHKSTADAVTAWNIAIKTKKEQTWEQIMAVTAPFFLGKVRRQQDAFRHLEFPVINQIEGAFFPPLDGRASLATELALAEGFLSHVRRHSRILELPAPETQGTQPKPTP